MRSGSENGSGLSSSEYTVEKIAVVAPMQRASVRSVVTAMPRLFQRSRKAWRRSPPTPVRMPAPEEGEASVEDMFVDNPRRHEKVTRITPAGNAQSRTVSTADREAAVDAPNGCASVKAMSAPAQVVILAFNASNQLAVRRAGTRLGLAFVGADEAMATGRLDSCFKE